MTSRKGQNRAGRALRRILLRGAELVLLAGMGATWYLMNYGFPPWLLDACARSVTTRCLTVDAENARLEPREGVVLQSVRIYCRGRLGPPMVEAAEAVLDLDPAGLALKFPLRGITARHCVFRPELMSAIGSVGGESASGTASLDLRLLDCTVRGVRVAELACRILVDGPHTQIRDIRCVAAPGGAAPDLTGEMAYNAVSRSLSGRVKTNINPQLLLPLLDSFNQAETAKFIRSFSFHGPPPECDVTFRHVCVAGGSTEARMDFHVRNCAYRRVAVAWAEGACRFDVSPTNNATSIDNLRIARPEGFAEASLTNYPRARIARFDGVSGIDPKELLRLVGVIPQDEPLAAFEFAGPVRIAAHGIADYGKRAQTDFDASIEVARINTLGLTFENFSSDMRMTGITNSVTNVCARMSGGAITGSARFVIPGDALTNTTYSVKCSVKGVGFDKLASAFLKAPPKEYHGEISGQAAMSGRMGKENVSTVKGDGHIAVSGGQVFMLPLFGGLSPYMRKIIPGLDFVLCQTDANSSFAIANGRIRTDEVNIKGDVFSLRANGEYRFDGTLDFEVRVMLMKEHTLLGKLLQFATYPISKLFEFRARGPLDNPRWSAFSFPRSVFGSGKSPDSEQKQK